MQACRELPARMENLSDNHSIAQWRWDVKTKRRIFRVIFFLIWGKEGQTSKFERLPSIVNSRTPQVAVGKKSWSGGTEIRYESEVYY